MEVIDFMLLKKSDWRDALQHVQVADFVKAKDCSKDQAEVRNAELS